MHVKTSCVIVLLMSPVHCDGALAGGSARRRRVRMARPGRARHFAGEPNGHQGVLEQNAIRTTSHLLTVSPVIRFDLPPALV
ncbi:hypothetical protein SZ55_2346 [Pseudomonas sp. FeS53a]|nr:hypothetical protein SZ55_2346 [Pseudomonas sp. FeS53a]